MSDPHLPKLFRYLSPQRAIEALESHQFHWSHPSEFNDPFDSQWDLMWMTLEPTFLKAVLDKVTAIAGGTLEADKSRARPERLQELVALRARFESSDADERRAMLERLRVGYSAYIPKAVEGMRLLCERMMDTHRVICLTENATCLLMWAHYARDHKGMLIEVDPDLLTKSGAFDAMYPVEYEADLPRGWTEQNLLDFLILGCSPGPSLPAVSKLLRCKSNEWSYEREWRGMIEVASGTAKVTSVPFADGCIRSVCFGLRTSKADIDRATSIVRASYSNVELSQAHRCLNKFGIELKPH